MIDELKQLLPQIPLLIKLRQDWQSLLINKYLPIIHRLSLKISDNRALLLQKVFNTNDKKAYMHSHSWKLACYLYDGEYEMGVGYSEDRNKTPETIFTSFVKSGDIYEILSPDLWHYTKPIKNIECTHSAMLIGERYRERRSENNLPLSEIQKQSMFKWYLNAAYYRR